ncbi:sensor histidine kinase [Oceanobacter mangrovi]|uniref:sensor histidine kinase n=1 Tax=Oceanobacter mangrovi TaxID=2862510 RepID=UPI001C8EB6B8|nr:ATP-binding protein [Oceanobacter mangrovi]
MNKADIKQLLSSHGSWWQSLGSCLANAGDCLLELRQHLLISLVFVLLLGAQWFSLNNYWESTLNPRLRATAEVQANIIAQSQTAVLIELLEHADNRDLARQLDDAVQEMLVVVDPATATQVVKGVALQVDYELVPVAPGSLDLTDGQLLCNECFKASLPLINSDGAMLGVADFVLSNENYHQLAVDMKSRLFRESALVVVLLLCVWIVMLVVFHRLHQAKRQIEASDRAKTRFMANVTHELRTPLNGILGYTQLMKADDPLMQQHQRGIKTIDRCARHLLLMINDILDFSRADEEKLELHPQELHLPSFLLALIQMTEVRARERGIELECIGPDEIPTLVLADEKRLRQVALNLTSNAIKFTERGKVTILMEILNRSSKQVTIRWRVIDTGIGIAAEDQKKIFIPFQQLDNNITRAEGSGLGLSICQRILQLMGSRLQVESEPGQGSEFWFDVTLPLLSHEMTSTVRPEPVPDDPAKAEQAEMELPPPQQLQQLLEAARQHNILAIRSLMNELEQQQQYQQFYQQAQQMVAQYRFKALAEWLQSLVEG